MNSGGPKGIFSEMAFTSCAHGLTKKAEVPDTEIERVLERKRRYERDAAGHRYEPEEPDEAETQ